jgi:hypothetical protein
MNYEEVKYNEEVSNIKTHKTFWFLFFGITFIVIVISLWVIFVPKGEEKVSNKELIAGATLDLRENDSMAFKFGDENHGIKINFVGFDSAGITIFSEPITFILELNEARNLDINSNGIYDIKVKLVGIENGVAIISIKRLYLVVCEENWNCSKWNECSGGEQARFCEDLNSCGTMENKPYEKRECLKIQFVEENSYFENGTRKNSNSTIAGNLTNNVNVIITNNQTNNTEVSGEINNTNITVTSNQTIVSNDTTIDNFTSSTNVLSS